MTRRLVRYGSNTQPNVSASRDVPHDAQPRREPAGGGCLGAYPSSAGHRGIR